MELHWTSRAMNERDLIYDIKGEHIRILRVLHTARRWPPPDQET